MTSPSAAVQPKRCDPLLLGDAEIDEVEEFVNEVLEVWSLQLCFGQRCADLVAHRVRLF